MRPRPQVRSGTSSPHADPRTGAALIGGRDRGCDAVREPSCCSHGAAAITAEALLTLQTIRAGSTAPIIVTGVVMSKSKAEAAGMTAIENAVAAAVAQFADSRTYFIPVHTDPVMPWITGSTWTDTVKSGLANNPYYLGGDGIHPVDAGTHFLARRIARAIKTNVLPAIP